MLDSISRARRKLISEYRKGIWADIWKWINWLFLMGIYVWKITKL